VLALQQWFYHFIMGPKVEVHESRGFKFCKVAKNHCIQPNLRRLNHFDRLFTKQAGSYAPESDKCFALLLRLKM